MRRLRGSFVLLFVLFAFPLIVSSGNSGSYGISLVDHMRHRTRQVRSVPTGQTPEAHDFSRVYFTIQQLTIENCSCVQVAH